LFPVSGIAALEVFFRGTTAAILDKSPIYLQRLNDAGLLRDARLDWTLLQAVIGKRVTAGEIVAHVLPLSQLSHLERVFTAMLGKPFRNVIGTVTLWPSLKGSPPATPILKDVDSDFEAVGRCFALRHQIAHEDYAPRELHKELVIGLLQALNRFTLAISELVSHELYPASSMTDAERDKRAKEEVQFAEDNLTEVWADIVQRGGEEDREALDALWTSFEIFRKQRVEVAAQVFGMGGSLRTMVTSSEYAAATREFATTVRDLKFLYEPEPESEPREA
jgi:hypothetical protein